MVVQPEPATSGIQSKDTGVGSLFVSNYPPFSAWSSDAVDHVTELLHGPAADPGLGLYIHIPFCRKRCKFCYFKVYTDKDSRQIVRYIDAVVRELETLASYPALKDRLLRFVYFGGGTPSFISVKQLEQLVGGLKDHLAWNALEEVTFECEPGTLKQSKLEAIRDIGVTRLSLGVENFDDEILRENGRAHVSTEIYRVLPWIREVGFDQLNIDLIAGMVGETWETWRDSVQKTLDIAPEAVTIYQMELPFNAVYSRQILEGESSTSFADWETKRAWQEYAFDALAAAGYEQSSAYTMVRADSGARFVYRDALWHGHDLLGIGVSSFSHLGGVHFQNSSSWGRYLEAVEAGGLAAERAFATSADDRLIREMILQLKLGSIRPAYFREKFDVEIVDRFAAAWRQLESEGMLTVGDATIDLTRAGLLRVDSLLPNFYDEHYRHARYT